jgi:hypothetical protein
MFRLGPQKAGSKVEGSKQRFFQWSSQAKNVLSMDAYWQSLTTCTLPGGSAKKP